MAGQSRVLGRHKIPYDILWFYGWWKSTQGSVDLKEENKLTSSGARHIERPVKKWKASTQEKMKRVFSSGELPHVT